MKRRDWIKGVVAGAAATPITLNMLARPAYAAGEPRALFVYIPDGCIPDLWHPSQSGAAFSLPEMSSPLESVRQYLTFVDGLDMYAGGATHEGGTAKVLTGNDPTSVDVRIGQELSSGVPFPSLHLGVGANFENGSGSISRLMGTEVKPDDNPINAFERLFGMPDSSNASEQDLARRRDQSVLDAVIGDLDGLRSRLGAIERVKTDVHLESLREFERRLMGSAAVGGMCSSAGWNSAGFEVSPTDYYPKTYHRAELFQQVGELQEDLTILALSCGMTRAATLMWSHAVSPTHLESTGSPLGNHDASHYGQANSDTARHFVAMKRWFVQRFANFVQKLANTPDGDGNLLESTVVLLCTELGDSNLHDHSRVPFVIAGGSRLGIQGGRSLSYRGQSSMGNNEAHTKLLVSIANAVGVPIDAQGYTGHGTGSLVGL